eukprot:gnl/MRDRNA2_/MRDRNA2_95327_c0_seq1.p1 gnl/MRDRNA2_/MRDRNA2_95327_c0~~gnl/MRDRNA2_/MRDRNA2_95327_c0_seq1.p1  ORF type:complete len:121 (-),score=33.58 gnl/MRDRNA2_/MRDRNA2_95327_c0_seq1:113-475(-)
MGWGGKGKGKRMDAWTLMAMLMGKGKGKGKKSGMATFATETKVWVGNIPEGTTYQELQEHFKSAGTAKFASVFTGKGKGTGGVAFAEAAEAEKAIKTLNGSTFKGVKIEVDVWTKVEKAS